MTARPAAAVWAMAVGLSCALALLSAGPAQAAQHWDVNSLPTAFVDDARVIASSITVWSDPSTFSSSVTTWATDGSISELEETKQEAGQTVVILDADILFEFAKADLPTAASARIGAAVTKAAKGSAVSIGGHTDDVGADPANLKLSQDRAQAVAAAVKAARPDLLLTVKGFGESKPVASNTDPAGRAKNRRVEIRFAG